MHYSILPLKIYNYYIKGYIFTVNILIYFTDTSYHKNKKTFTNVLREGLNKQIKTLSFIQLFAQIQTMIKVAGWELKGCEVKVLVSHKNYVFKSAQSPKIFLDQLSPTP